MSGGDRPKVLVIGLDMGDGDLIRQWAREGDLPNLAALMETGATASLGTTADQLHVSAWPTLYTGATPGVHGVYYTFQPAPGLQGYRRFAADQYGVPTVWRLLDEEGVRCTVFDAPYTHPESGSDVTQVFDWGTWAHYWKPDSTPGSLLRRLNRDCRPYPLGLEAHDQGLLALDPDALRPRLLESARAKTEAILWLMDERPWDCFFAVYGETHLGGHYLWWPPSGRRVPGHELTGLKDLYQEIDRGLGRIVGSLPEAAMLFIVSGDSVGPNYSGWHLLPEVLRRAGLLAEPTDVAPAQRGDAGNESDTVGVKRDPVKMLRDLLPKDFRKSLARRLPTGLRDALARRVDTAAIDWTRTRAYTLPTDLEGCIRVNLKGREPQGIVGPGAEYEETCDQIVKLLSGLTNPATGQPAVSEVVRTDRRLVGPRRDYLPDLVVLWSRTAPIEALESPEVGGVSETSPDGRPGTHTPPGFMLARGPGISSQTLSGAARVRDVAPTILSIYDVDRPDYMEGSTLVEVSLSGATEEMRSGR